MVYDPESYPCATSNTDFNVSMYAGIIKATMNSSYKNSSKEGVQIQEAPVKQVVAKKACIMPSDKLKLVALSSNVCFGKDARGPGAMCVGKFFKHAEGHAMHAFVRSHRVFPAQDGDENLGYVKKTLRVS